MMSVRVRLVYTALWLLILGAFAFNGVVNDLPLLYWVGAALVTATSGAVVVTNGRLRQVWWAIAGLVIGLAIMLGSLLVR
jgi:hypothetical protein